MPGQFCEHVRDGHPPTQQPTGDRSDGIGVTAHRDCVNKPVTQGRRPVCTRQGCGHGLSWIKTDALRGRCQVRAFSDASMTSSRSLAVQGRGRSGCFVDRDVEQKLTQCAFQRPRGARCDDTRCGQRIRVWMGGPGQLNGKLPTPTRIVQQDGPADWQCPHRRAVGGPTADRELTSRLGWPEPLNRSRLSSQRLQKHARICGAAAFSKVLGDQ